MAELTGVEPVPADRQSAIPPIDIAPAPSSGVEPRFPRSERGRPLDEEGISRIVKELDAGERFERPYPDSKSRVLPLDDPASTLQWYRFHAPHTQYGRLVKVVAELLTIHSSTVHQLAMTATAFAIQLLRNVDFKTVEFNRWRFHNLIAARRIELPSQP